MGNGKGLVYVDWELEQDDGMLRRESRQTGGVFRRARGVYDDE